jgi:hypothetical protein
MSEWQSIESAPKDGTPCLVSDGKYVLRAYFNPEPTIWEAEAPDGCWTVHEPEDHYYAWHLNEKPPTHWQPIPPPPRGKE